MKTNKVGRPRNDRHQKDRLKAVQAEIDSLVAIERIERNADQLRRLTYLRDAKSRIQKRLRTGSWL